MAGVPIVLRRWSPIFDASQAKTGKEPIWVKLSRMAFELCTLTFFRLLRYHMGENIDVDYSYKHPKEMAMARILVLLDLREGPSPDVCLDTKYGKMTQILDYEGVPFHCHRCHSMEHLVAQCDRSFIGKWRQVG